MSARDHDDDEFERIVAGLDLDVPDDLPVPPAPPEAHADDLRPAPGVPFDPRWSDELEESEEDFEPFVPPVPEPASPADRWTRAAWVALIGGPLALFVLAVVGAPVPSIVPAVGVGAFVVGLVVLLFRRGDHDRGDDPDHGAVV